VAGTGESRVPEGRKLNPGSPIGFPEASVEAESDRVGAVDGSESGWKAGDRRPEGTRKYGAGRGRMRSVVMWDPYLEHKGALHISREL
jgi:hypothetical protein